MWDQWLDSTATVHRLSHGSQGSYKAPTVTWAQSLPALTSKVVEPRTFYPLYPYLCMSQGHSRGMDIKGRRF